MCPKVWRCKGCSQKDGLPLHQVLGKSGSKELEWDKKIAALVYSHLNMTNWTAATKKAWWEAEDKLVAKWVAETLSAKRSEVTQGIHRRFLGKKFYSFISLKLFSPTKTFRGNDTIPWPKRWCFGWWPNE